ncbi:glycosyltransferase, partial [Maribacter sp.]|uniref:glycosyltransferase n=1 Tax=Maribacter sp. TaxID=1897614 RepID=UPI0025B903E2
MNPKQGGPCQGIRNAIPEFKKLGIDTEVVCFNSPKADFIQNELFKIYALDKPSNSWGYNKKFIPWLLQNLERYDVAIIHGLWLYQSHATIKAILSFRKTNDTIPKVYVMPHGMLDPYFQKAKDRKVKALRNAIYWKLFENKVVNQADGILFTCEEELLLARTTFPNYRPKKEINVGYGIQPP